MDDPNDVSLIAATESDAALLANLLELYIHDLTEIFGSLEIGPDGRFGYRRLPLYWSEPRRFPFVIRSGSRVAGFALAKRGSPADGDPMVLDVEEFFVLRQYRRSGVGRRAAALLWKGLAGRWTVRVAEANSSALRFWRSVVAELADESASEFPFSDGGRDWRVLSFTS
jgi:predicted acetyltransferase